MYVELHTHSCFSLLDGASTPEALVARAAKLGYPALALTDHDELGGVVRFAGAAAEAGIGGIVGVELTVTGATLARGTASEGVPDDASAGARGAPPRFHDATSRDATRHRSPAGRRARPHHLVLLAETREGYGNISTLVTRARMDAQRGVPSVPLDVVAQHARGVFALTGCPGGLVPSRLAAGDETGARRTLGLLAEIFERRVAVECWDHGLPEERAIVHGLLGLARAQALPWVVTNDVHYAEPGGRIVHDVLACLRHERALDEMGTRLRPNGEWYLKSVARLRRRWRGDDAGLRATLAVADRCAFRLDDLHPTLPAFPLPPGVSADEYLERLVEQGASERWPAREPAGARGGDAARQGTVTRGTGGEPNFHSGGVPRRTEAHDRQIAHELGLIRRLGLAGYFLIVWDIVRFARREGILCQGRGSAANSAVCYCLGITAVDPVRMNLLFERFLSEERREAPDIDLDFAHRDRERVLQYVYERYGREHAAMVCEQITWRGRSAVRDAARVLGFSVEQADALSAMSDRFSARATAEALRAELPPAPAAETPDDAPADAGAATGGPGAPGAPGPHGPSGDGPVTPDRANGANVNAGGARVRTGPKPLDATPPGLRMYAPVPDESEEAERPHVRRDAEKRALARTLGDRMVRGTEATTRAAAVKRETRRLAAASERPASTAPAPAEAPEAVPTTPRQRRSAEHAEMRKDPSTRLTSSDRPRPNAAYEPYGSPPARDVRVVAPHEDPYAADSHVERRNPTTALAPAADGAGVLRRAGLDPKDRRVRAVAEIVDGLHGLPRHRSIHVGGFVLTAEPLSTVVPIEPASMPGRTVIQWEKDDLDPIGLVKIDLLGLGMLTVLQDCLKYIRETRGVTVDLAQLDMTDQSVYDDLCKADTIGVFQVESRAQMNTLPRLKPRCFYDLVVEVALIRPGPIQGDMVHPYLRRRAGLEPVTYPHPSLEPILKRTLGVPLFQEQGMQVAIACAGFSGGEADNLRRAMGHKRSRERMAEICQRMIDGMRANGIDEETATKIYNQINAFADYGFPESHAASFALLVYASAYLRHYYAPEFTAAMLNAQPMGFYAPGTLIEDARRHGVHVRPVDLTRSAWDATLEFVEERGARSEERGRNASATSRADAGGNGAHPERASTAPRSSNPRSSPDPRSSLPAPPHAPVIRLGLRSVHGLGPKAQERIEAALAGGPFTSVGDVVRRAGLDRRALRLLAEAGAFDAMIPDEPTERRRRAALWRILDEARGDAGPLAPRPRHDAPPTLPPMSAAELTEADYRVTGVSLLGHPMRHVRPLLAPNGIRTADDVVRHGRDGERVGVAGLVICRQRPGTARGFVFLTLEDETGLVNVVVTPKRFEGQALLLSTSPLLLVRGVLQVESGVVNIRGDTFRALESRAGAEHARSHDFH